MRSVLSFLEVVLSSSRNNLLLEINVMLKNILEREDFRLTVDNGKQDHAEGCLELSVGIKLIENDLRICVTLEVDRDVHTCLGGIVVDIGDTLDLLVLDKVCDAFDKSCFVYVVRNFRNLDLKSSVLLLNDLGTGTDNNLASSRCVSRSHTRTSHNNTVGREVGALDMLHKLVKRSVGIVDQTAHSVDYLTQIVRRNVGCHTDGDTH